MKPPEVRSSARNVLVGNLEHLTSMLQSVPYAAGVNNHQGSLATSNAHLMNELMPLLRAHQLFFVDSRTTAATVAYDSAQAARVPCAFRNVPFLDDVQDVGAIHRQLEIAARDAQRKGSAIAIGHPHPATCAPSPIFCPRRKLTAFIWFTLPIWCTKLILQIDRCAMAPPCLAGKSHITTNAARQKTKYAALRSHRSTRQPFGPVLQHCI